MHTARTRNTLAAAILALSFSASAFGQQTPGQSAVGQNSFGVFAGFTDFDQGSTNPTLGLELDHKLEGAWSAGGVAEHTSRGHRGERSTLVLGTLNYRPPTTQRLKLTGGAGYEFNRFGDDIRLRVGAGYDVVQGPVILTPRIALDFGNGRENLVLGATAYFRF